MYYKRWWDCGKHYTVILQYFSGCNPMTLESANVDVRWKIRRLEHVSHLREINRIGNLTASVCLASSLEMLQTLEPLVRAKVERVSTFPKLSTYIGFERYQESLVIQLKHALAYYLVRAVEEFPPSVSATVLLQLFLGAKDICISEYINIVRSMQGDLPGGVLGYRIPGVARTVDWYTLCGAIRLQFPDWPCGGEGRDTALKYGAESNGPTRVLIDAENVPVDVIDQVLNNSLWAVDATKQRVILFDSERQREVQYQLLTTLHPGVEIRFVDRVGNGKSQVDFYIRDEVNKEFYCNGCRNFIIISSDADYASLVEQFPGACFTYMVQRSVTARAWRKRMKEENIKHIYLDESLHAWNIRVFNTEVVFTQGQKLSRIEIANTDLWNEFVSRFPPYGMAVFDTARRRLLSQREE